MKTFPTCFQISDRRSRRSKYPRNGGSPCRASFKPARMAKKIATAGCIKNRKLIGPPQRPTRLSQPRAKPSSMDDIPSAAPPDKEGAAPAHSLQNDGGSIHEGLAVERPFLFAGQPGMPWLGKIIPARARREHA